MSETASPFLGPGDVARLFAGASTGRKARGGGNLKGGCEEVRQVGVFHLLVFAPVEDLLHQVRG